MSHSVRVDSGKYTLNYLVRSGTDLKWDGISILRHGEAFHEIVGPGFDAVHSLMCELDAARVVVAAAREAMAMNVLEGGLTPRQVIENALKQHEALVSDLEPPSEWAR